MPDVESRYKFSGAKLRSARQAAGLTHDEVGERIDRCSSMLSLYELEYRTPPILVLVELADLLDVHVEEFFVVDDEVPARRTRRRQSAGTRT